MYCREIMHANIHALCVLYCGGINDSIGHSVMFTSFLRQDSTFFSLLCLQPGVSLLCTRRHTVGVDPTMYKYSTVYPASGGFFLAWLLACAESFVS